MASEAREEHRQQLLQWHLEPDHLPSQQALWLICPCWFGRELRSIAWEPPEQHALIKQKETSTHLGGELGSGLLSRRIEPGAQLPPEWDLSDWASQDSLGHINPKA